ncbi:MAG TPA: bifunctional diaminohydroxyphosphoribosylaminopyrimidine deaminase/5-amino-6-(5-phosphoribosylamino)uracil reductase RibD [Sedimentisphaerales bacterium]|nr:bifunctional diaminohydroxyphosphoribosylaminopyrimidine deaminase/5-amino-6-(5-phosphoribosylamino)uracil reductase RibD [Sedimentisphaerales bacterium]
MSSFTKDDEKFMTMALKLARRGIGSVEPNPPVGCVIVKHGSPIGRGYHRRFGLAHAEVNAILDCRSRGGNPKGATMYVTLEPCAHHGKTPPCTEAIVAAGLARVVIATRDPAIHGREAGAARLRRAGVKTEVGLCEADGRKIILPFTKYVTQKMPWVILKWAQSIDGKLAHAPRPHAGRRWISNELSRADVHQLRREVQAIAVSGATVAVDDPLLTPRPARGARPLRVVIDNRLMIPLASRLLNDTSDGPVMIITTEESLKQQAKKVEMIRRHNAEVTAVRSKNGHCDLADSMRLLASRGIQKVLVEPGPHLAEAFLSQGIADEVRIYIAPKLLAGEGAADMGDVLSQLPKSVAMEDVEVRQFDNDVRIRAFIRHS